MKIVIDVNHPAHVHYFKHLYWELLKNDYDVILTASEKDVSYRLLKAYKIPFISLGTYGNTLSSKLKNLFTLDYKMYKAVRNINPDLFIGFGSIRNAHISSILGKKSITFEDSEPSPQEHLLYVPFTDYILTPNSFKKDFGRKHVRFNGYMELAYLHPNWFTPDRKILDYINLSKDDFYSVVRFVSWDATHDIGRKGLEKKLQIINELEKYGPVFLSSEKKLPSKFSKYQIQIPCNKIHDLMAFSSFFVCDGQTMTTEAAILGIPTIRSNSFVGLNDMGNFIELEKKYGLIINKSTSEEVINSINRLCNDNSLKKGWSIKRQKMLNDKIDVTTFILNFIKLM